MIEWTIKREDGTELTFDEAKIVNVTRTLLNQQSDTAVIEFGYGDMRTQDPWLDQEWIEIRADDVIWFAGRYRGFTPGATGRNETFSVLLTGPWEDMERTIYERNTRFATDPLADPEGTGPNGALIMDDFETEVVPFAFVFSGLSESGGRIGTRTQIITALNYAIDKGANFQLGTIDAGRSFRAEELRGPTCAEMVRKALRWTPSQKAWFDYTTVPPTLHIRQLANQTELELNVDDEEWESIRLEDNRAAKVSGVRLEYWSTNYRGDFAFRTLVLDEAGPAPGGRDALIVPIELSGSYKFNGEVVAGEDVPEDLAAELYSLYQSSWLKGTIRLARAEVTEEPWNALRLVIVGGNRDWPSNRCVVQKAVCSTATGRTELTVGPPDRLGPNELYRLLAAGSGKPPPSLSAIGTAIDGGSDVRSPLPDEGGSGALLWKRGERPEIILNVVYSTNCTIWHYFEATGPGIVYDTGGVTVLVDARGMSIGDITVLAGSGLRVGRGPDIYVGTAGVCNPAIRPWTYYLFHGYVDDPETGERIYDIQRVDHATGGCPC